MTTTRFAPSPTGHLHLGNLRTALFNFLVSRKDEGDFILRIDDTDSERSRQEFVDSIMFDLEWLGLHWDRVERQSERLDLYADAADRMRQNGRLYECFETPEELSLKRRMQLKAGRPPVYDRESLRLTDERKDELRSERPGYWRFLLNAERVEWDDSIQGNVSIDAASVSDPVLIRADGQVLYTLASVADDLDMGIASVVRGADHITNTAAQIQIMGALGSGPPGFAHHSLLTGPDGGPLAKREGSNSVRGLRESGIEPMTVLALLAALGTSAAPRFAPSPTGLAAGFDFSEFGTAPARVEDTAFRDLNARYLASQEYEFAESRIMALGVPDGLARKFWQALRENISTMDELADWWSILRDGAEPAIDAADLEFVGSAFELLPEPPFGPSSWKDWTEQVASQTGRKGRSLYMPLRLALTGRSAGPGMPDVMELIQQVKR